MAKALSLSSGTQQVSEHAREAAEAELDLARIRKVRAFLLETLYFADTAAPDGIADLNSKLAKLERYERRAARPARHVKNACASRCRNLMIFLLQPSMIAALLASFWVLHAIAVIIIESFGISGTAYAAICRSAHASARSPQSGRLV